MKKIILLSGLIIIGNLFTVNALPVTNSGQAQNPSDLQVSAASTQAGKKNTTKYSGNVEISQNRLIIHADNAVMQNRQKTLLISGKPATFTDLAAGRQFITGSARTMNFDTVGNKLILKGDASITQNGKTESGKQQIIYDTETRSYTF